MKSGAARNKSKKRRPKGRPSAPKGEAKGLPFFRRYLGVFLFFGVTVAVFISRIPGLKFGAGRDPDAWRMVSAGQEIAETGQYVMSRPPGHPVPEYVYSLFAYDPWPLFWIVGFMGAVGIAVFALIARRLGCKDYLLATFAVALTPVVYINGTNFMDYTWAFTFVLLAFYFVLRGRSVEAGILTGIAIGCRITSGAMLVPFSIYFLLKQRPTDRRAVNETVKLWVASVVTSILIYLPVILKYGTEALEVAGGILPLKQILSLIGPEIWGSVGLIAVFFALVAIAVQRVTNREKSAGTSIPASLPNVHAWAWLATIVVLLVAFIRLPHEAAYLIPIVPFIVLLFARYAVRPIFVVFCIFLIVSSFVELKWVGVRQGRAYDNFKSRSTYIGHTALILEAVTKLENENVIVAGWLAPQLDAMWYYRHKRFNRRTIFEVMISDSMAFAYGAAKRDVYLLPYSNYYVEHDQVRSLILLGVEKLDYQKKPGPPLRRRPDR